ncbi:lipopolysaccharide biosynthesis protein [Thermaurantiacus sp.]
MNETPPSQATRRTLATIIPRELFAYGIKGANVLASLGFMVLLARLAGAETVGHYNLAFASAAVVMTLALGGLDRIITRHVPGDLREGKSGEARATLGRITRHVAARAALLGALMVALVLLGPLATFLKTEQAPLALAGALVLVYALLNIGITSVRAVGMPLSAQTLEALHSAILLLIMLFLLWAGRVPPTWLVMTCLILAMGVSVSVSWWIMRRVTAGWDPATPSTLGPLEPLGRPFMLAALTFPLGTFAQFAMISNFGDAAEVGAFRTAAQVAMLVNVLLVTGEAYILPRLAGDWRVGDVDSMWRRFRRSTLIMSIGGAPIILACLLFPEWILTTLFGAEFAQAAPALRVLALSQGISMAMGPINGLLGVAGREKILLRQTMVGLLILVIASFLLLPQLGLIGAAIADLAARSYRGLAGTIHAWRHLRRVPG